MRSASPRIARAGLFAICGVLLVVALAGCTTTQETAAKKQAQSKRILERREHKRKHKHQSKSHEHGSKQR